MSAHDAVLIPDMPAEAYHADPCDEPSLSSGIAKILLTRSPRAAWRCHPRLNPKWRPDREDRFDLGTSAHELLLEGTTEGIVVVNADDWRTKAAREQRDEAHAAGKTALLARQYDEVAAMMTAAVEFLEKSEIARDWNESAPEQTIIWREDDVWIRARLDKLTPDRAVIFDYKTTENAAPTSFARHIVGMNYHVQEALYRRAVRALGFDDPKFLFLAQETEPPYDCALFGCDPHLQKIGDDSVEQAIAMWRECMRSKEWRGYGGRVHWVNPPIWLQMDAEERLHG